MKFGLSDQTLTQIRAVLSQFPAVEKAVLYGSRAKGTHRPASDIDLTLLGEGLTEGMMGQIDSELDDLLRPCRFDLSRFATLTHAELVEQIEKAGTPLYERHAV